MLRQSPLNVVLDVLPEREPDLVKHLSELALDGYSFSALPNVHFARWLMIPSAYHRDGRCFAPKLVLATNYDGTDDDAQLRLLVAADAAVLSGLLGHCVGFTESVGAASPADPQAIVRYLARHKVPVGAHYVNTIGRDLEQVALEARLVRALGQFLDERDWSGKTPEQVRSALIERVSNDEALRPALIPPAAPTFRQRLKGYSIIALTALLALSLTVLLLPLVLLLVIVLRVHEVANRPHNLRPRDEHIRAVEAQEDLGPHNQLSAVGILQRGPFRRLLLRAGLGILQMAARYVYNAGKLAEIDTIHFARWVVIDRGARLYFLSNYDGSPESYQDDFIERVAFGLNLVFSNGAGWPRTKYLVFGGASDELAFKAYYRAHQLPTQIWYVAPAYRGLTAVNVANNAAIRKGLSGNLSTAQCREWLQRL